MSTDKRSVATDALETLGTIIGEGAGRDAIHLAVEPIIAGERLWPGQHVGMEYDRGHDAMLATTTAKHVGIVDPFLPGRVEIGERFWLVVFPRTITSLRHVWSHPAFAEEGRPATAPVPASDRKAASEQWLRDWCAKSDCPDYDTVLHTIIEGRWGKEDEYGEFVGGRLDAEYLHFNGRDAHGEIPDEFWDHVEVVTGKKPKHRPSYFSCSC